MYPKLIEAKLSMNSVTALKFVSFVPSLPSIFTCNVQELSTFIIFFVSENSIKRPPPPRSNMTRDDFQDFLLILKPLKYLSCEFSTSEFQTNQNGTRLSAFKESIHRL